MCNLTLLESNAYQITIFSLKNYIIIVLKMFLNLKHLSFLKLQLLKVTKIMIIEQEILYFYYLI